MFELRHYDSKYQLVRNTTRYEVVDTYGNESLAFGMRKKKALEPQYRLSQLKVVHV